MAKSFACLNLSKVLHFSPGAGAARSILRWRRLSGLHSCVSTRAKIFIHRESLRIANPPLLIRRRFSLSDTALYPVPGQAGSRRISVPAKDREFQVVELVVA